jgi:hypothetical protein
MALSIRRQGAAQVSVVPSECEDEFPAAADRNGDADGDGSAITGEIRLGHPPGF